MSKISNVPQIRFKGFTDAWEQRKLGDITTFNKGKGYSKKDLVDNGTPIILYGRLYTDYQTLITKVDTFVAEVENSVISEGWEVIVPASGESAEDISRASVVAESGIILGGDLNIINKCSLLNPVFLALTISNGNQQKEMSKRAQGKSVVHLHNSDLKEINIVFPEIKEQSLIGEYFEIIDKLITLHQRKYDQVANFKKAMLEKMFPKNGSRIPEIRFKGFSSKWEKSKAKNLCNIGTGKSNTQDQVEDGIYPFYIRSENAVRSNKYLYDCEAVITIGDGNIGKVFHYINGKFDLHQRCYKMTDFQNIFGKYFYYYFSTRFYDRAMKMTAKATVDSIRLEMISEMDIWKPVQIEEQIKIAEYFEKIDRLIELHHHKLQQLKNIKKAMLEKMFV